MKKLSVYCLLNLLIFSAFAQPLKNNQLPAAPIQVNGVFPGLSVVGVHEGRSETRIGALMVWANKIWMVSNVVPA